VRLLQSLAGVSLRIIFTLIAIVIALWSDSRSKLDSVVVCKSGIPFVIAKSNRSGNLLLSVG
jgi:hypothetical protein